MKLRVGIKSLGVILLSSILLVSCTVNHHHTAGKSGKVPPGKAKKVYGTKSAKPYAPGQNKKGKKD